MEQNPIRILAGQNSNHAKPVHFCSHGVVVFFLLFAPLILRRSEPQVSNLMGTQFSLAQKTEGIGEKWGSFQLRFSGYHYCGTSCQLQKPFVILIGLTKIGFAHMKRGKPSKKEKVMDVDNHQVSYLLRKQIQFKEEIIVDIFKRLPVRSLLRFKCVLKFWKILISQSYFKMEHLSRAMNDINSQKFLVSQWRVGEDNMFSFYSSPLSSVQPPVEDVEKLDCPSNCKPLSCVLHCSCDGLVVLSIVKRLFLWNPSTRESIELPRSEHTKEWCTYELGYDAASDDYKILNFDYPCIGILALKSGSWREHIRCQAGFEPLLRRPVDSFAFLHGAFHWVGSGQDPFVVSFSISDEVYGEIHLLEPMLEKVNGYIKHGVSVLGGMLCFYYTHRPHHSRENTFKVWVMKEYGVKESWIPLYIIQDNIPDNDLYFLKPIYMFADGEVLLNHRCIHQVGFNLPFRTSKGSFGLWPGIDTLKQGIMYTESLISPKSPI